MNYDQQLWSTDGDAHTHRLNIPNYGGISQYQNINVANNKLYFLFANDVWQCGGDSARIVRLTNSEGLMVEYSIFKNDIYCISTTPYTGGFNLFKYNPSSTNNLN